MPAATTKTVTGYLTNAKVEAIQDAFLRFDPKPDVVVVGDTLIGGTEYSSVVGEVVTPLEADGAFSVDLAAVDDPTWTFDVYLDGPNIEHTEDGGKPVCIIKPPPLSGIGDVGIGSLVVQSSGPGGVIIATNLNDLADVDTDTITAGQGIEYNGTQYAPHTFREVPAGGATNEVLTKDSATDYDASWKPATGGTGTGLPSGGSPGDTIVQDSAGDPAWTDRLHLTGEETAGKVLADVENTAATGSQSSGVKLTGRTTSWEMSTDSSLDGGDNLGVFSSTTGATPLLGFTPGKVGVNTASPGAPFDVAGAFRVRPVNLVDAASITTAAAQGNHYRVTITADRTLAAPTGGVDGQTCRWAVTASGADRAITLATGTSGSFLVPSTTNNPVTITSGDTLVVTATYNSTAARWIVEQSGGGDSILSTNITDATPVGLQVLTAADQEAARDAIGTVDALLVAAPEGLATLDVDGKLTAAQVPDLAAAAQFRPGDVKYVRKDATTGFWPASYDTAGNPDYTGGSDAAGVRPTDRDDVMFLWVGPDPSPDEVLSGVGGILDGVDLRIVTP